MSKTALITGASYGIGEAFARELAHQNYNLVLVARSQEKLEKLAQELQEKEGIEAMIISQDLTENNAGKLVYDHIKTQGLIIDLLINNAGFGDYGNFCDRPLDKQINMIQLNITVLTELTGLFLPDMKSRGKGRIINVASIAAFQPLPYMSIYGATKAFVLSFSEAIWAENRDSGINILALCPGPTESKFFERAEFPSSFGEGKENSLVSAEKVVKEALMAVEKNQCTLVTGGIANQIIVNLSRFFPRELIVAGVEKQFNSINK